MKSCNTELPVVDLVAGARPNFMKLASVHRALLALGGVQTRVIHTGQHYDKDMDGVFFQELGIPKPAVHLGVGSGTQGVQTARILERFESHLLSGRRPSVVVVLGDVNSTVACALAAVKLQIPVAHVEAGLRSNDRSMPEEINRILTDAISDLLFVSEPAGLSNLGREGIDSRKTFFVGNVMIDTLLSERREAERLDSPRKRGLPVRGFGLVTIHRPSNVDDLPVLERLVKVLVDLSLELPLVFPVHPRTVAALDRAGLWDTLRGAKHVTCLPPIPYRENLSLMNSAKLVLTDSGGIQEEAAFLGVPCLTLRDNTERPITTTMGTSRLVGNDPSRIRKAFADAVAGRWPKGEEIPLWDGRAGERIARVVLSRLSSLEAATR